MALTDKLQAEKAGLESYLDSVRGSKLEQNQINRLLTINGLLGIGADGESSSDITSNSSIQYGAGVVDAKTQRIVIASNGNSVVFASPQAVTQSGSWDVTNISGTVSLPTGASTSALQTTGNTALSSIDIKTIPAFTNSPVNFGVVNQAVLKASTGVVYKLYCYNKSTSVRFFQIHNKAAAPVNNDVPIESFPIAPNNALILDSTFWGASGRVCSVGVSWAFSSTEATLTLATAADQTSSVGYL